jgi:hypothetical protein
VSPRHKGINKETTKIITKENLAIADAFYLISYTVLVLMSETGSDLNSPPEAGRQPILKRISLFEN